MWWLWTLAELKTLIATRAMVEVVEVEASTVVASWIISRRRTAPDLTFVCTDLIFAWLTAYLQ